MPIIGAFAVRRIWRLFRKRFDELRLAPQLDYRKASLLDDAGADFRFFGGFESINDKTLWIKSEALTVPVDLTGAKVFLLPLEESSRLIEAERAPRPIQWNQVSAVSEGARIFVGGRARRDGGRIHFVSTRESPLLVILYDGQERSLLMRAVRAGRHKNEYWNQATPYSLALGIFSHLLMALTFADRPAFAAAFVASLTGAFGPLLPILPPGLLFTTAARSAWRRGRSYRALRDLVRLPLLHLEGGTAETVLPDGSVYGVVRMNEEQFSRLGDIPKLPPEAAHTSDREQWYCYGTLVEAEDGQRTVEEPKDPSAVFAAAAAEPEKLAADYSRRARLLEIGATVALFSGLLVNAALASVLIDLFRRAS